MHARTFPYVGILPVILLGLLAGSTQAQPNQAPAPPVLTPTPCADTADSPARDRSFESPSNQDLSDKLAESNGVLCPPKTGDPSIQAPPNVGRTPVIPAPGTPGGNPSVQPR
jgi:hypothetical protein